MEKESQLSHVRGNVSEPLRDITIGSAFDEAVREFRARPAIISRHQGARLTFGQLKHEVDALAAGLLRLGLRPGDRVGIWAPNCIEWTISQLSTAKAGLILVNINPAYRSEELKFALNKVECRALIMASSFKSSNYDEILTGLAPELASAKPGALKSKLLPHLQFVISLEAENPRGFLSFEQVMAGCDDNALSELAAIQNELAPGDPINIQFTSGTTGSPKGATLSHSNILNNAYFCGKAMRISEQDRICIPVPLYHCFGMVMGNLNCMQFGAAAVYPSASFEAVATLEAVGEEKCTALYGVPTMFVAELEVMEKRSFDLSSLRTGVMAGAPCPVSVMERVVADMNMSEVTIGYGMTETSPISFQTSPDDPIERRVSTVGRVHPHVEVKVGDEAGVTVPCGVQGELMTRGYSVMLGYWNDEEKTNECITEDGWMRTGDLGVIDQEGYGNVTGRVKDMVIRGGENIFPREVEEYLYRHPDISDVQVFGVPDEKYGEELCAWIVSKPDVALDENSVKAFCKDKISHFKIPRYIRFVEGFPMTVTGKAQKFEMRETMIKELGLQ